MLILIACCFRIDGVGSEARELVNRTSCFVRVCAAGAVAGGGLVGRRFELVSNGCHACLARCRDSDAFDEVGHCHFDVEFDEVGERMELDVSGRNWVSKGDWITWTGGQNSHKGIRYRHGGNDHDVHEQRYHDNLLIKANKLVVLGEAIVDQVLLHSLEEIPVQRRVGKEVEAFFDSVPVLIDEVIPIRWLVQCLV